MTSGPPHTSEPGPAALQDGSTLVGFRHHLRPATVPGKATYLVSRQGVTTLYGALAEALVPLLDGTRSLAEILHEAAPALTTEDVEGGLRLLSEAGLLRFCSPAPAARGCDPAAEAYWDLAGLDGARAAAGLVGSRLRVLPIAGIDAEPVLAAGVESGLNVTGSDADLTLVLCDDYLSPELERIDAEHRAAGKPWLLTRLCGYEPWIGPFFRPDEGPCWSCLATRLKQHRRYEGSLLQALGLDRPLGRPIASLSAGRVIAAQSAVLEAAKWLAGLRYADQGSVRTVDTLTLRTRVHAVPRIPQCPSCGEPGLTSRGVLAPFVPASRPKAEHGGGHRALTPDQLLKRYEHLVSPITGIVPVLEPSPGAPEFATTYVSGRNLAMRDRGLAGLRSVSGGKGLTDTEARASALCESVERYSGTRHGDEPVVVDTLRALGDQALHPNSCQLYADRQFRERDRWNRSGSSFHYVPEPFDENRPVEWTPVWSLTGQRHRFLPTSMLYFPSGTPSSRGPYADSNGNAAGSSPEDAMLQGFLELVERDAVALWWYNRTRQPAIDLDSFDEPYIERLRNGYRKLGRELWALDLTSDLGIPAVVALSRRTEEPTEDIVFGFGAHFDPALALRRALTEMGQLLPAVGAGHPGGYRITDPLPVRWWQQATLANQSYLAPDSATRPRTPRHWNYVARADLLDDVKAITELADAKGLELLILDQTRPDVGMPVVKVLVPGLRHFWARYAPGRLFDIPVKLGRLTRATPYEQLNPIPLFV